MQCICNKEIIQPLGRGRPAVYCSDVCRKRGERARNKHVTKINIENVTKKPDIMFYCGLNEKSWNHHVMQTGKYVCIAPVVGKREETKRTNSVFVDPRKIGYVLQDSGAFCDKLELANGQIVKSERLTFEAALNRQITHAYQYEYFRQISHIASYDLLIDETWKDGERSKIRWSREAATYAVNQTVLAAQYLSKQRKRLRGVFGHTVGLALSAQGVEVEQYVDCAKSIVACMEPGDVFGLGGWCITGMQPDIIMPAFKEIIPEVIAYLASQKVNRVHIWGVIYPEALGILWYLCNQHGIDVSTDSSGPCRHPVTGNWGYASWRKKDYKVAPILASCKAVNPRGEKAPTCTPDTVCRGLERNRHVQLTRDYLANFSTREPDLCTFAPLVKPAYVQDWLFEM